MIVDRIWKTQPGRWFCLSTKDRKGKWQDHFFKRNQFKLIPEFIDKHSDKDLYWCPHGFRKPRRLKACAEIPKLLWADLDSTDPRECGDLMPTIAWESSPGRYAGLWVLDSYMTEETNRALTMHLKADPGGWDLTQVLRIPGTRNYKYTSAPKGRLLWSDGPTHMLDHLRKKLPRERKPKETNVAIGIYRKYEKNFNGWVRRQLLKGKPQPGKRSEVLWRLVHELTEAGVSRDEAFELLRVSPWNKFSNRRNGDEQLKRELDKALEQHLIVEDDESDAREPYDGEGDEDDEEAEYRFLSRSMADVEEENLDWIWYPYLARGEVSILEGDPGLGKSYLAQMIAKAICDGEPLMSVKKIGVVSGKVAYFDLENSSGTVTKKRLTSNGMKHFERYFQDEEPFSIDDDERMEQVYDAVDRLRPTLVVFDTMNTYMGGADTHKASEVQQVFKRFVDIARRFKCSVMVLRHLTKSNKNGDKALYRGQGSIAFSGMARVVMTVGVSPDDKDTRVMAVTKLNVARIPKALTFTIESVPDTIKEFDRSRFVWGDFVDLSADEIIASSANGKHDDEEDVVTLWLRQFLDEGAMSFAAVMRAAGPKSFTEKMVMKAANAMGIRRDGEGKGTMWSLPEEDNDE